MEVEEFDTIDFRSVPLLSRRIGQRYGFAALGISRTAAALLGGAVHFESSKTDMGRGNPVPFSQVHCVDNDFNCSLLTISSASDLPCPRLYHSAAKLGSEIVVFGGQAFNDKRKLADIWTLSLSHSSESGWSGIWRELPPASRSTAFPPPRSKHAVTTSGTNSLIVSGGSGFEDSLLGDLWMATIDTSTGVVWKKINCPLGKVPPARKSHALSRMVSEMELLLHGGVDSAGTQLNDLWILQFVNEEKSRCVWTQLVSAPSPRSGGLVLIPSPEDELLVFGGNQPSVSKYSLRTGEWSICPFAEGVGHAFVAVEMDAEFPLDDQKVSVPSVLMIPDTVLRSNVCDPWLASIFPINFRDEKESTDEETKEPNPETLKNVDLESSLNQRRADYRQLAAQLPCLIPPSVDSADGAMMMVDSVGVGSKADQISESIPQSPFFVIDYLATGLFATEVSPISVSSWSACHILATAKKSAIDSLESLKAFLSMEATVRAVNDAANSCVIVVHTADGDKLIAFLSEALNRHSLCSKFACPVISLKRTNYAQVQATLRLVMTYTPFRSPAALEELFALFTDRGAGFLLIDFDGESDNNAPLLSHYKPAVLKDSSAFWTQALLALTKPRPRIEQYALTLLDSTEIAVNGQLPGQSLKAVLKSKLLAGVKDVSLSRFGSMIVGKLKGGSDVGVLIYCEGMLIRHLNGRFPWEEDDMEITAIVELAPHVFTPVHGALSDFHEAVGNTAEWTLFLHQVHAALN